MARRSRGMGRKKMRGGKGATVVSPFSPPMGKGRVKRSSKKSR